MAMLERILYPSNRFAFGVYAVVLSLLAIFAIGGVARALDLSCAGVGFILGWTAHVIHANSHRRTLTAQVPLEFNPYRRNLERAQTQLDRTHSA